MQKVKLLADEDIDVEIVDALREQGYDILYVAEMDPGIDDERVLDTANRGQMLLLTGDKDFGELVFQQRMIAKGVILLRLAGLSPKRKASLVTGAINTHEALLSGAFTVISPGMVRIRPRIVF